ncbi:hypothetical protein NLG97_g62 [Lecanicillium saksenae]|uniref:Uncharacterized protein n=1 Tax=Lecanicillium saksenae TaxID=468837 RepID=A0ACC1R7V2_9HYPO|nr:hypothetical protein NLG97_g62 [Lecanicillium saksenae]
MQPTYIEVSQLAPSTSFYAAVLQPLGLRYLTSDSLALGPEFAIFGSDHGAVLYLRHVASPAAIQLVSVRISAPSPTAIQVFYNQAVNANPAPGYTVEVSLNHSSIFDLDGNKVQAIFNEQACSPNIIKGQFTIILKPHPATQVGQVLGCDKYTPELPVIETIENGGAPNSAAKTMDIPQKDDSNQTNTEETKNSCGGISAVFGALIGVAAGAAAGAAITYSVMSSNSSEALADEMNERQRVAPAPPRTAVPSAMSTGLVDREYARPLPARSQRIKFEQDEASTLKKSSTRLSTLAHEKDIHGSWSRQIEYDNREQNENQLVRIPRDSNLSVRQPRSKISPPASARRLAILPPASSPSTSASKLIEDSISRRDDETTLSARTRRSSSSLISDKGVTKRSSELPKDVASSSTSKRDHSRWSEQEREFNRKASREDIPSSKSYTEPDYTDRHPVERSSTVAATEVSSNRHSANEGSISKVADFSSNSRYSAEKRSTKAATEVSSKSRHSPEKHYPKAATEVGSKSRHSPEKHYLKAITEVGSKSRHSPEKHSTKSATEISSRSKHSPEKHSGAEISSMSRHSPKKHSPKAATEVGSKNRHSPDKHFMKAATEVNSRSRHSPEKHSPKAATEVGSRSRHSADRVSVAEATEVISRNMHMMEKHPTKECSTTGAIDSRSSHSAHRRSITESTEVSQRSSKSVPNPSGVTEFFDSKSHISVRKSDTPSHQDNNIGEDRRSRVSARDVPLPGSRVGTSEFFDTVSHVSVRKAPSATSRRDFDGIGDLRSYISARDIPLPASCADDGSKVMDRMDRTSQFSARNIPLPASCAGTNYHDGSRSQASARNIPLPGSHVGSSRANWDDDMRSIAPSDSISCIGSK